MPRTVRGAAHMAMQAGLITEAGDIYPQSFHAERPYFQAVLYQ